MRIGLIVAAGKQSRFELPVPKCLMTYRNKTILDTNIKRMSSYCDKVYVVCSTENQEYFSDNKYDKIIIDSGKGSGDAILKSLDKLGYSSLKSSFDSAVIIWGDSLIDSRLYPLAIKAYNGNIVIPCKLESSPYVQLIQNGEHIKVNFSKYKDKISEGYHDMSLFVCHIDYLMMYLELFKLKYFRNGNYKHKHNNEFEFLDIFNDTDISGKILEVDNKYKCMSFNTLKEYEKELKNEN